MSKIVTTTSFKETQKLGFEFAKELKGGEVIALYGDLGSGKTTFVQGLAEGLGVERPIISPTFIILRTYQIGTRDKGTGIRNFYHVDLYRINSAEDVQSLGLLELLEDPNNIVAIEWPDKIENLLPVDRIDITFKYLEDDKREIRIG